ncbi:MAG: PQQ-binding-like beta-propeller repeat protein [Oligoflexia bacterium]|nr:PQQ-binding-like beta-propeller repeat protein [Oligoflexia bacterium]
MVLAAFAVLPLLTTGCSGRNIHSELRADTDVLVRAWTLPTRKSYEAGDRGVEFSNPILHENTLIFGNQATGLIALYPTLNQQRWSLEIPGGVISELAVEGASVYFGGGDGFLYSVSLDTGKVNWRYEIRNPVMSRPTVTGGRVFVTAADDTVHALDAGTGKWLWHYKRRTAAAATILGASAPVVEGSEVLVGLSDGFLVALSLADGQLKWERKLHQGTKFTDVDAHPVIDGTMLYVPSYDGALYALKRQGGEVLWRFDAGGSKQVAIENDKLYLPSSDGHIYALQKDSAKVLWKFELDDGIPTQVVLTDRYVIVGSSFQYLYVLDKATGKGLYRYNVGHGSGFYGSPAYDSQKQRVYFLSAAGNLYAFQLRKPGERTYRHGASDPYRF